jgi:hypothetical protein
VKCSLLIFPSVLLWTVVFRARAHISVLIVIRPSVVCGPSLWGRVQRRHDIAVTHTRCRHINHFPFHNTICTISESVSAGLLPHPCHEPHSNLLSQCYFQPFSVSLYEQWSKGCKNEIEARLYVVGWGNNKCNPFNANDKWSYLNTLFSFPLKVFAI